MRNRAHYTYTTQRHVRQAFWRDHTVSRKRNRDGDYCTDTRVAFCDFVEQLSRSGEISPALTQRVTLD